jgi:catechol 2,3-dioxygenase-like lactoylglutathione lyase family enzyme
MVDRGWPIRRNKGVGIGRRRCIAKEMAMTPFLHGLDCVDVGCVDYVAISSADLRRAVDFYRRLFGFRVIDQTDQRPGYVTMSTRHGVHLAIHERRGAAPTPVPTAKRWSFTVADLDEVRETIWNLGVVPESGEIEPRHASMSRARRSLSVCDPDGHEIELVERPPLDDLRIGLEPALAEHR